MPSSCSVRDCTHKQKRKSTTISYFTFPKETLFRDLWAGACGKHVNFKFGRICSLHFQADDYIDDVESRMFGVPSRKYRRPLKKDAVPSLNLPTKCSIHRRHRAEEKERRQLLKDLLHVSEPAVCDSVSVKPKKAASQTRVSTSEPHMSGLSLSEAVRSRNKKLKVDLDKKANGALNPTVVQAAPQVQEEGMQDQHASGSGTEANSNIKIEFEVNGNFKTVPSYLLYVIHNNPENQSRLISDVIEKGSVPYLKLHTVLQRASVGMTSDDLKDTTEASVSVKQENEDPSHMFSLTEDFVKEEVIDESEVQENEFFSHSSSVLEEDIVKKEETFEESVAYENKVQSYVF